MPRSSADRNFGYRAAGIVRILTAADADQVLTALEMLGLAPLRPETLEQAFENVVLIAAENFVGWVGPLNDLLDVVSNLAALEALFSQEADPSPAFDNAKSQSNVIKAMVISSMEKFESLREEFRSRMLAAEIKYDDVDWPPMPGIAPEE